MEKPQMVEGHDAPKVDATFANFQTIYRLIKRRLHSMYLSNKTAQVHLRDVVMKFWPIVGGSLGYNPTKNCGETSNGGVLDAPKVDATFDNFNTYRSKPICIYNTANLFISLHHGPWKWHCPFCGCRFPLKFWSFVGGHLSYKPIKFYGETSNDEGAERQENKACVCVNVWALFTLYGERERQVEI